MPKFIRGLKLSELYYKEVVRPILKSEFPKLKHSAARIFYGSEVMGFDTPLSMDHDWGTRFELFLSEDDYKKHAKKLSDTLGKKLPKKFRGFSTHWGKIGSDGSAKLEEHKSGNIRHRIEIYTIRSFFEFYINFNPNRKITPSDWLTFPQQKLRTLACGKVFHDDLGLDAIRQSFTYYPRDIWLYMLASQWTRISQEEHLMGRSGDAGDELGSAILGARLVRDVMRLCYMMEKEYIPYGKWFGTGFSKLNCAKKLTPVFRKVLASQSWKERERYLSEAYNIAAEMHNNLRITKPVHTKVSQFHNRPYLVIWGEEFANEIKKEIKDKEVRKIKFDVGAIDQISDSTNILENKELCKYMKTLFEK